MINFSSCVLVITNHGASFKDMHKIFPEKKKHYYICDRKKCEQCAKGCKYTPDIEHAKYKTEKRRFEMRSSGFFEVKPYGQD